MCKDDKDVVDVLKYLREREIVHFQRFGEALNSVQEKIAEKRWYINNSLNNNNNNNNFYGNNINSNGSCNCNMNYKR